VRFWHRYAAAALGCVASLAALTLPVMAAQPVASVTFTAPTGVAFDPYLNVYVAGAGHVKRISDTGKLLADWTKFGRYTLVNPTSVVADALGNVYIADSGASRVFKVSTTGKLRHVWSAIGKYGSLKDPQNVTISPAGSAYVADTGNSRIVELARSGAVLGVLGLGQLHRPTAVAVTRAQTVYVTDAALHSIMVFKPKQPRGATLRTAVTLHQPSGLLFDGISLYVADAAANRIYKLSTTGRTIGHIGAIRSPHGLAFDGEHKLLYVATTGSNSIDRVSPSMKLVGVWK
jgi:DNA-binding beta-propeller fold protein YncE